MKKIFRCGRGFRCGRRRKRRPRLRPRGLCRSPYRLPRRPNPPLVSATTACGHPTVPVDLCPAAYEQASFIEPRASARLQLGAPLGFRTIQARPKDFRAMLRQAQSTDGIEGRRSSRQPESTGEPQMRKTTGLFAFAPVLILAGAGGWVASNTQAPVATPTHVRIDTSEITMTANQLPSEHCQDFSVIFH